MPVPSSEPWFLTDGCRTPPDWSRLWAVTVQKFGNLPAVVTAAGTVTFEQLAAQAEEIERGMPGDAPVIAIDTHAADYLPAFIAAWSAGRTVLPFSRPHLAADRRLAEQFRWLTSAIYEHGRFTLAERVAALPADVAWHAVFFTSGSTGSPRAVARGWRQAVNEAGYYAGVLGLEPGWECRMLIEPVFGASTKHLLGCLLSGCAQVHAGAIRGGGVLYGTPGQIEAFARESRDEFGWISMTGEVCSPGAWIAAAKLSAPGGRCLNALGGTEFGVAANMVSPARGNLPPFLGEPLPGKCLEVISEDGVVLAPGEAGLLRVSSDYLAEGYVDHCEGRLQLIPFGPILPTGARSFMTGDVAVLEGGRLRVLGRSGKMLKRGARWLDTSPLHATLSGIPGVRSFVIEASSAAGKLCVWLELEDFGRTSLERVAGVLASSSLPAALQGMELRAVRSLPRNRHGKVDLSAFPKLGNSQDAADVLVYRPVSLAESLAAEIWADEKPQAVLDPDLLDSLGIAELCTALGRLSGCEVSPATVLGGVTFSRIRRAIQEQGEWRCQAVGDGREGTLLWFGGGAASAALAVGPGIRVVHWDLDRGGVDAEWLRGGTLREVARECVEMWDGSGSSTGLWVGGFSYGSLVAYECACLLAEQGAEVDGCVLLDPPNIRDRTIAKLRWSAFRASLLLALLSPLAHWFAYRIKREKRNARTSKRRSIMRRYRPSRSSFAVHLFACAQNRGPASELLSPAAPRLMVEVLPVPDHMDVVQDGVAIKVWSHFLGAAVRRGSNGDHAELSRAANLLRAGWRKRGRGSRVRFLLWAK